MPPKKPAQAIKPEHMAAYADQDPYKEESRYIQYKKGENPNLGPEDEVHEYLGPKGKGFVIVERKTVDDVPMIRRTNYGSEEFVNTDWIPIEDIPPAA